MKSIINGAPGVVNYGVQDLSAAPSSRAPEEIPQHLPKYFIFAKKGPTSEELLTPAERLRMYGAETFAERSKYFNHQTMHSNGTASKGNAAMYVRIIPANAGPKPNVCVYLDVLETTVDVYEREEDGSIKTTVAGDPVVVSQTPGYRVKFVTDHRATYEEAAEFGNATIVNGDQTDASTGKQSKRYPLFEVEHSFQGESGNLAGFRLWAQNLKNQSTMPTKLMAREKVYPYSLAIIRKDATTGTSKAVETIFGEQSVSVSFKQDVIDPLTLTRLYIGERFVNSYQSLTDVKYARSFGEFGQISIYQANIDLLLKKFQAAEAPFLTEDSDFTADVADMHLFNFVTGTDSNNSPYNSYIFTDAVVGSPSVRFSQSTNVFAAGGSDGDMTHEEHALQVAAYMERYANENDELNDVAYHVESHIYDSGYPLDTKYALLNAISNRKDIFVHLSPSEYGQRALTAAEEYSLASALYSRASLHPESTWFGTSVYRVMIQGSAGRIRGSQYTERFPLTYSIGTKSAEYMGAGNGVWKNGKSFEGYPGSLIDDQFDLTLPWTPDDVRNRNWDVGLNWVQRMNHTEFFFPAYKTVYDDDTSVLTGYVTACAIIKLHKIVNEAQRRFTGRSDLTPAQFSKKVNDFVSESVKGIFDGRFIITPKCYFTSLDEVRNYSWTLPVEIQANGAKTVMTTYIVAKRMEDAAA